MEKQVILGLVILVHMIGLNLQKYTCAIIYVSKKELHFS